MSAGPHILVVGEFERSEFEPVRDWLLQVESDSQVTHIANIAPTAHSEPDLVIVCQSWPDEFSAAAVTSALGRWPLSLWVVCFGAWCASDGRTRTIWPLSVRVPADESRSRLQHVWRILRDQRESPLPLTASRDETLEFDVTGRMIGATNLSGKVNCPY